MIMKRNLLVLILALMTSMPMTAADYDANGNLLINENNFPDPVFREWLKTNTENQGFDQNWATGSITPTSGGMASMGVDGLLTASELERIKCLQLSNLDVSNLQGIELFPRLRRLEIENSPNLIALDVSSISELTYCRIYKTSIHSLDFSNCSHLAYLVVYYNDYIEQLIISENTELVRVYLTDDPNLTNVELPNSSTLKAFSAIRCPKITSVDVSNCPALLHIYISTCNLSSIDLSKNTELISLSIMNNNFTSLDLSKNTKLEFLNTIKNHLTSIDLSNNPELKFLTCQYNHLTELVLPSQVTELINYYDLPNYTIHTFYNEDYRVGEGASSGCPISPQTVFKDYVAIDGRNKIGLQCNTNTGVLANYDLEDSYYVVTDNGNNYIIVGDGTTDIHGYDITNGDGGFKKVSYIYKTGVTLTNPFTGSNTPFNMTVNINTAAHGLYIHPETLRGSDNFYSGTLYLEFPARIPEGVQCYYAKGLDANEDLVGLTEVTGTIPANTAVIVKASSEFKFFAFNESDETPAAPTDNIIEGTIEGLSVTPGTVLTLGHNVDRSTGEYDNFGFWNYRGNKISPFRAYIPKSNLSAGAKNGFSLLFPENGTTGIARMANSNATEEGTWYTLSGTRISGKPTTKGIYVNKGQKVVIR